TLETALASSFWCPTTARVCNRERPMCACKRGSDRWLQSSSSRRNGGESRNEITRSQTATMLARRLLHAARTASTVPVLHRAGRGNAKRTAPGGGSAGGRCRRTLHRRLPTCARAAARRGRRRRLSRSVVCLVGESSRCDRPLGARTAVATRRGGGAQSSQ